MGNTASCIPYTATIKVINGEGRIERYAYPVRAAEIMVENPGHFVCDSNHLKVGYRIPGLTADNELELHRLYFLLPLDMLYSVLTEEEMVSLPYKASNAMKIRGRSTRKRGRRIIPVLSDFCLVPAEAKQVVIVDKPTMKTIQVMERTSKLRSWRPALDTIEEVT